MTKYDFLLKYTSELIIDGFVMLPNLLLKFYKKLGLTETELLIILHLWRFKTEENIEFPDLDEISGYTTLESTQVQSMLASLIERKILAVEHLYDKKQGVWVDRFSYLGLFDKLMEYWAICKAKELEAESSAVSQFSEEVAEELFKVFENEFGRLLSPFEVKQIIEWCKTDNHSPELVLEALKRASLRGIKNLKYIDSILLDWSNNNISTLAEIERYEKDFKDKQQSKEGSTKKVSRKDDEYQQKVEKYKDVYIN
ncbi:MAG: DnaD domain protein [Bacillota bacterium]